MSDNPKSTTSTSFAYLILAGTSCCALRHTTTETPWALGTFAFLLSHGIVGFVQFSYPNANGHLKGLFNQCSLLAEALPLPLINTELYLLNGYEMKYACLHVVAGAIPLLTQFATQDNNDKIIDLVMIGNVSSLVYLSADYDCPWAGALAALTALNHFIFRRMSERLEVPRMDIVAIGLSFFVISAVNCLCEAKYRS